MIESISDTSQYLYSILRAYGSRLVRDLFMEKKVKYTSFNI